MNNIQAFFVERVKKKDAKMVVNLGGALQGLDIEIKPIDSREFTRIQEMCIQNPESNKKRKFDTKKFNEQIVLNGCVNPNFKDPEFLKELGFATSEDAMYACLWGGEMANLSKEILTYSGFADTMEEDIEEVKN